MNTTIFESAVQTEDWSHMTIYPRFPNGVWYCEIHAREPEVYKNWITEHMTGTHLNLPSISDRNKFYLYLTDLNDVLYCKLILPTNF